MPVIVRNHYELHVLGRTFMVINNKYLLQQVLYEIYLKLKFITNTVTGL